MARSFLLYLSVAVKKDSLWLRELAKARGGICLSEDYTNSVTKYLWQCQSGHQWETTANRIQQGTWCPYCAGKAPHDRSWLQELAQARGGVCLSTKYSGALSKYLWQCQEGHQWQAKANTIQQGRWCLVCSGSAKHELAWLQELASKKNGKCLATEYVNVSTRYLWQCQEGHQWREDANSIRGGHWCPHCAGQTPHPLSWLHDLASKKNGKCLATEYLGVAGKYLWQCQEGHQWQAAARDIAGQNNWCPVCARKHSNAELQILAYVRTLYPEAVKARPLSNPRFEVDVYIPSLRKAIEYDGSFWHKSEWALRKGIPEKDARKDRLCQEAGISLLRIDEDDFLSDPESVFKRVRDFLGT